MNYFLRYCLLSFSVIVFSSGTILACSCARSGAVDTAFAAAPNVVIMKVQAVEKAKPGEKTFGYGGIQSAQLSVEKGYKGALKVGQLLTFQQGGGADCVWTFNEDATGTEYLFYLAAKPFRPDIWIASTCSR